MSSTIAAKSAASLPGYSSTSSAGRYGEQLGAILSNTIGVFPDFSPDILESSRLPGKIRTANAGGAVSSGNAWQTPVAAEHFAHEDIDVEAALFESLAGFKILTSQISMHMDRSRRDALFLQLDELMSPAEWDPLDKPTPLASFRTFIRMLLLVNPNRLPGLGVEASGCLIAAWFVGVDRLTIVCEPNDTLEYMLSAAVDGNIETSGGNIKVTRLVQVLEPFAPRRWFGG